MTRHAAHGLFRLSPALLVAGAALVLTAAVLIAACGGSTGGGQSATTPPPTQGAASTAPSTASSPAASASPSAAATTTLRLYFLRDGKLGAAQRQVPHTLAVAPAAVTALLAGPTAAEQTAGLSTSLANGITLDSIAIRDGVAHVDLSAGPGAAQAGTSLATQPAPAQIVYTLTQFPGVKKVAISVGADSNAVSELNGGASSPLARSDFHLEPGIFVEFARRGCRAARPLHAARQRERVRGFLHGAARRQPAAGASPACRCKPRRARLSAARSRAASPTAHRRRGAGSWCTTPP